MAEKKLEDLLKKVCSNILLKSSGEDIPCPSSKVLRSFIDRELTPLEASQIAHHLLSCNHCAETVLAWNIVEHEDGESEAVNPAVENSIGLRRATVLRRMAVSASFLAAAAAIAIFVIFPYLNGKPGFKAEIVNAAGTVRGNDFSQGDAIELKVVLPEKSFVYVVMIDKKETEFLFPGGNEEKSLEGKVILPGEGSAWSLSGVKPGQYFVLVGRRKLPLTAGEKKELLTKLGSLPGTIDMNQVRQKVKNYFKELCFSSLLVNGRDP